MEIGCAHEEMVTSICTAALSRVWMRPCRSEGSSQTQGPRHVHGPVEIHSAEAGKRKDKPMEVHLSA